MKKNKVAQFLGIFAKDEQKAKGILLDLIIKTLSNVKDDPIILESINKLQQIYQFPKTIHCTTLFVGGRQDIFKKSKMYQLKIAGLAISPYNIITCILDRDDYQIEIANQYPHITTLVGKWKPKDSNDLLTEVFKQIKYDELKKQQDQLFQLDVVVNKQNAKAYVFLFKDKFIIDGMTNIH
ncbi:hypothetical protein pb186bvf_017621 [Paramecium bursaria]